jgi:hypothetical protein
LLLGFEQLKSRPFELICYLEVFASNSDNTLV